MTVIGSEPISEVLRWVISKKYFQRLSKPKNQHLSQILFSRALSSGFYTYGDIDSDCWPILIRVISGHGLSKLKNLIFLLTLLGADKRVIRN